MNDMNKKFLGQQILKLIKKNLTKRQFTARKMAEKMDMSYSYLYEITQHQFQMSPHRLLELYRMEAAMKLVASDTKMIHAYKKVGYRNIRSFREAFGKRFEMNYSSARDLLEDLDDMDKERKVKAIVKKIWNDSKKDE